MAAEPYIIQENVLAGFASLLDAAEDMTEPFRAIAAHLEYVTRERFEHEVSPDGTPWIPSQRVIEGSRRGAGTLDLTGDLRESITSDFGRDFAAFGPETSGGAAIYAAIHQFGGRITPKAGSGKKALNTPFGPRGAVVIPARPYVGLSGDDRDVIRDEISKHLTPALHPKGNPA